LPDRVEDPSFHTLAAALACADNGTQINLGAGSYTAQLAVNHNVILQGAPGKTILTGAKTPQAILSVGDERSVTLPNVTVTGQNVSQGVVGSRGNLVIATSTIQHVAGAAGGALYVDPGTSGGNAAVVVTRSTVAGSIGTGIVVNGSDQQNPSRLLLVNSTVTGAGNNLTQPAALEVNEAQAQVTNSTLAGNSGSAGVDAGAGPARILLTDSIIAANGSIDCQGAGVISGSGNVIGQTDSNCPNIVNSQFDIVGTPAAPVDPLLRALATNGGPTQTMALQSGSPAIGHASTVVCHNPPVAGIDQRGVKRLTSSCDSGAYDTGTL
jgi:hypothetical protein